MPIVVYEMPASPPCRAVIMTARMLAIDLEKRNVDLMTGEHLKPDYLKINPQHTVPTIEDNGFILWESRAIMTYLVDKYAPGNPLYPKDLQQRATVNRMLNFDIGTLHSSQKAVTRPLMLEGRVAEEQYHEAYKKALKLFDDLLERTPYAAGDHLTLADISIIATLSMAEVFNVKFDDYPRISAWMKKVKKEIPVYDEVNEKPLLWLKEYIITKAFGK